MTLGDQPAGAVYIDLFEVEAPLTVANFLNYIDDGAGSRRYDGTFIHRSVAGFVVQGGGFAFDPALGAFGPASAPHIPTDAPVQNEFDPARSNLRGTMAMAKLGGDPDSATSEWFINLADNSANLDTQNGGFTVFGTVLGNGMQLVDAISDLAVVNQGGAFSSLPVVDQAAPVTETNLVILSQVVLDPPAAIFADSQDIDFGLVGFDDAPVALTLTLQNIGGQDLVLGTPGASDALAAPFAFAAGQDQCSGQTLASLSTCTVAIEFVPATVGDLQDSFDVPSNDAGQPALTIMVRGAGASPTPLLGVQPALLDFGTLGTGQPATQAVTLTNLGEGQLLPGLSSLSGNDSAAFSLVDNACDGASLALGEVCTLSVRLVSSTTGTLAATLNLAAEPGAQTAQVGLTASVTLLQPAIQLPDQIVFDDVRFDASGTAAVSMANTGVDDLFVSSVALLGTDAALFSVTTSNCIDTSLAPQSPGCSETLSFQPTAAGEFSALLRIQSNDPDRPSIDIPVSATASQDADGVSDSIEQAAPNAGDGNQDGIPDNLQESVASLPGEAGYVTIETSAGALRNVRTVQGAALGDVPTIDDGTLDFSHGFFAFLVDNVPPEPGGGGGSAVVTLRLPEGQAANNYFKFGRLPGEPPFFVPEHWYTFAFDPVSRTGAEFSGNQVILHLTDGGRGDNDQLVDGRISDPGGPATLSPGGSGSGGGGCTMVASRPLEVHRIGLDIPMLLFGVLVFRLFVPRAPRRH